MPWPACTAHDRNRRTRPMRISIVTGFFLPVPPVRGGSTEKIWHRLAREFSSQKHEVTFISRAWPGFPDRETADWVRHIRLRGCGPLGLPAGQSVEGPAVGMEGVPRPAPGRRRHLQYGRFACLAPQVPARRGQGRRRRRPDAQGPGPGLRKRRPDPRPGRRGRRSAPLRKPPARAPDRALSLPDRLGARTPRPRANRAGRRSR